VLERTAERMDVAGPVEDALDNRTSALADSVSVSRTALARYAVTMAAMGLAAGAQGPKTFAYWVSASASRTAKAKSVGPTAVMVAAATALVLRSSVSKPYAHASRTVEAKCAEMMVVVEYAGCAQPTSFARTLSAHVLPIAQARDAEKMVVAEAVEPVPMAKRARHTNVYR
jgi:hypothetical protein